MKSNSAPRVALLIETTRSYTRDLLSGVREYLSKYGRWSTFIELRALDSEPPAWLRNWEVDGILTRTFSEEMSQIVQESGIPAVELRSPALCPNLPWVGMDNREIGALVAEHFISRGYRNFAAYTLDTEVFFRERIDNFITTLARGGHRCDALPSRGDMGPRDWEKSQERLGEWLQALPKPVGIFAANDQLGVRLLDACMRHGIAVPEDVAVVGTENEETLCSFATPTLTSVRFDGRQVGCRAAEALGTLMAGGEVESEILIEPPGIETRESTSELVIEDGLIRSAIRMIREKAFEDLSVEDVCHAFKVSRSTLERRMRNSIGRAPKEEMLRIRFKEARRLLRETDFTIDRIAEMTGFAHPHYFQSAFKEKFEVTPGAYRKGTQVEKLH